mgnify:CR=1 FL=1|jgi:hypothetical protein
MPGTAIRRYAAIALVGALALTGQSKQKQLKPGFNLFSKDQDIQMGREYAAQIEREMEVVQNPELNRWLQELGEKLARAPEADKYPYSFKIVHEPSINAFALPGGPTFTHTGLIAQADNESQVAGVLGHEIAHVALRHGTNQASKAQLLQLPAVLGGAMAGGGITGTLAQLGIGLGANGVLMKFSRNAETDADILGTRILHQAGYNPIELARFFEKLQAQSGKNNAITAFMSSHPDPGNRKKRIEEEIRFLPAKQYAESGQFERMRQLVKGLPAPQKRPAQGGSSLPASQGGRIEEARPAGGFKNYQAQGLAIQYPGNWEVFPAQGGGDVTIAPRAGIFSSQQGAPPSIGYGLVIGQAKSQTGDLGRDTQALVQQLVQSNQGMRVSSNPRQQSVNGRPAFLTMLTSPSPWGGNEADWLVTVQTNGGLAYFVFIAPEQDLNNARPAFEQMISSLRLGQ